MRHDHERARPPQLNREEEHFVVSAPPEVGILVPEAIGLLLEDLGLDDTLTATSSMALVRELATLHGSSDARLGRIGAVLASCLERARSVVRVRREVIADARLRGLEAGQAQIEAAVRVLEHAPSTRIFAGLSGLPAEVETLTLHELDHECRRISQAASAVSRARQAVDGWAMPSALTDLDLEADSLALHSYGRRRRLLRARSGDVRERVRLHLAPPHRGMSASEMATVLDHVKEYSEVRGRFHTLLSTVHPWVRWAVNADTGEIYDQRTASLRWILSEADAGNLGAAERELLTEGSWRRVLTGEAGRRWSNSLRGTRDVPDTASLGSLVAAALNRFAGWLTHPPHVTLEEFNELSRTLSAELPQIAGALVVAEEARGNPTLQDQVQAVIALSRAPFGPGDDNRPRFRAIVEQVRGQVDAARSLLGPLRPQHQHLIALVGDVREAHGLMLDDLRVEAPARGPLRVAIAGRTKAGKTTLRKVLTRDLTERGIGRGAHRTTRTADAFNWDQITFVDTPGVSARDDDYDAEVAVHACRDADAVIWMFAESLHEEEAQILQALLSVKPVLVVYNAKGRVDSEGRLGLFARNPGLTFADEAGHAQRSRQMAAAAGVRNPLFVAVHAGAARRGLQTEGETHPAWLASRIGELESELRRALVAQAQGLRSLRLADQVRTPLLRASVRAEALVDALAPRCATVEHRISKEELDLRGAVLRAVGRARAQTLKNFAAVSADLPGWLEKVDGRGDSLDREWSTLLADLDTDEVLGAMAESLRADARASGLLLDREDQLEEILQRSRLSARAHAREGVPLLTRASRFLGRLVGLVFRNAPRFRQEAALGLPGWIALAADVLATTGRAVVQDVRASRIDRRAWEKNADQAVRSELERVRVQVLSGLDRIEIELIASVESHFAQSRIEVARVAESLAATSELQAAVARAVAEIDRLTVERLFQLGGLPQGEVIAVDRVPNLHLKVTVAGDPQVASHWLSSVLDGCSSEAVTVTRGQPKHRRSKELQA